jgi:hypothetical protein
VAEQTVAEARSVMQFVHVVALLVDAQRALELGEGLTHREVTLAAGGWVPLAAVHAVPAC